MGRIINNKSQWKLLVEKISVYNYHSYHIIYYAAGIVSVFHTFQNYSLIISLSFRAIKMAFPVGKEGDWENVMET